eukprot:TRINITY_DN4372_c0_g1_i1.p3 TRINITY_DN4372_c0_g1~~TRINITY_DN4372_c0_g1_i1.p3  ORF type:complete len:114 (+),score=51.23 TRINITY_DN4372_c0_g1_i1:55-396(+)
MLRRVGRLLTTAKVQCFFDTADGRVAVTGQVGQSLMEAGKGGGVDIEAACDGECACCTCHCFVEEPFLSQLPERSEDEEDMLDMAPDLQDNSRLACQITLTEALDGITVKMPE